LTAQDRSNLLAYLRQLDGKPAGPAPLLLTFADWAQQRGLSGADALPGADSDFDGLPQLAEYGQDLEPGLSEPFDVGSIVASDVPGDPPRLVFRRNALAADLLVQAQRSGDLLVWGDVAVDGRFLVETIEDPDLDGDGSAELVRLLLPEDAEDHEGPVFWRLVFKWLE
jgi:hypothetical protein